MMIIKFKAEKYLKDFFMHEASMCCDEADDYGWTCDEFDYHIDDCIEYLEITIYEKDAQVEFKDDYLRFTEGRVMRGYSLDFSETIDGFHISYERG